MTARSAATLLALILVVGRAGESSAAPLSWILAGNGAAATAGNWSPAQVPAAADALTFNLGGTRTITWSATVGASTSHTYRAGVTTLQFGSPHFASGGCTIGSVLGDVATVTLNAGTFATGGSTAIGSASGSSGTFTVTGDNVLFQTQNAGADVIVGGAGSGTLALRAGGIVRVSDDLFIGNVAGGVGNVSVSGAGSFNGSTLETEDLNGDVLVANLGNGTLTLGSAGVLNVADDLTIANNAGTTGTVTVSGAKVLATVKDLCLVSANGVAGSAAGTGTLTVGTGATMLVQNELRVGDVDGGKGVLHMNGGILHTHAFLADSLNGGLTLDGGTLRIDAGAGTIGGGVSLGSSVAPMTMQAIRGAIVNAGGDVFGTGTGASAISLLLDSGATLSTNKRLILTSGTFVVTVDSSATLTTVQDINLGGSNSNSTLTVDHGGKVNCVTFESADEATGQASILVQGLNSRINWTGTFFLSGDAGHGGGPTTMHVGNNGGLVGTGASANATIYPLGTLALDPGGSLSTAGSMTLRGRLDVAGGTGAANTFNVFDNGIITGHGTLTGRMLSTQGSTRIAPSGGALVLGSPTSASGYDFRGTLDLTGGTATLLDQNGAQLGDSTILQAGTLTSANGLTNPINGMLLATDTINALFVTNFGTFATSLGPQSSVDLSGSFTMAGGSELRIRVNGTGVQQSDRVNVSGLATLNGNLHLVFGAQGSYFDGVPVTILSCGSRSGTFPALIVDGMDPAAFTVVYTPTAVQILFNRPVAVGPSLPREVAFAGRSAIGSPGPWFELALPADTEVHVALYDVRGRRLASLVDGLTTAGVHRYVLPAGTRRGVYYARAIVGGDAPRNAQVALR
jgi:T5SS/PEP-CTERM-associated repeat protein